MDYFSNFYCVNWTINTALIIGKLGSFNQHLIYLWFHSNLCLKAIGQSAIVKYTDDNEAVTSLEFNYPGSLLRPDRSECRHHAHGPEPHEGYPGRVDPRQHGHARQVQAQDQAGGPGDGSFAALILNIHCQDILNILFHYYPDMLYELPCEWNYRVWQCSQVRTIYNTRYLHTYLQYLHTYLHTISIISTLLHTYLHTISTVSTHISTLRIVSVQSGTKSVV